MPDRAPSATPPRGDVGEDRAALIEEIARQKEEILRLRDLLILKDEELGAAKGGLAELAEYSARFAVIVRRLKARLPGFVQRRIAAVRRLRQNK
jgi:hypothetical protein